MVATAQEKQGFFVFIFPHRAYTVNLAETLEKLEGFTSNTGYTDVTFWLFFSKSLVGNILAVGWTYSTSILSLLKCGNNLKF